MPIHDWTRVEAGVFHHFHGYWVGEIGKALNRGLLPADYYALTEQVAGIAGPDVLTLQLSGPQGNGSATTSSGQDEGQGTLALATAPPRVRLTGELDESAYVRKTRSVVIRHVTGDRVVALVEILSPGNKSSRNAIRSLLNKVTGVLNSGYHLLLIDLHPPGRRDPQGIHGLVLEEFADESAYSLPPDKPLTLASYTGGDQKRYFVEQVAVGDTLPDMPLFLDPEHYVPVPLEAAYREAWEAVPRRWRTVLES
jgi:Protein of unknown function (DUF4058)